MRCCLHTVAMALDRKEGVVSGGRSCCATSSVPISFHVNLWIFDLCFIMKECKQLEFALTGSRDESFVIPLATNPNLDAGWQGSTTPPSRWGSPGGTMCYATSSKYITQSLDSYCLNSNQLRHIMHISLSSLPPVTFLMYIFVLVPLDTQMSLQYKKAFKEAVEEQRSRGHRSLTHDVYIVRSPSSPPSSRVNRSIPPSCSYPYLSHGLLESTSQSFRSSAYRKK